MSAEASADSPGPAPHGADLDRIARITGDQLPPEVQEARRDPSRLFGKYILLDLLGRGGNGFVRKAWDPIMGQYMALKFLGLGDREKESTEAEAAAESERLRSLIQEARLAARLRHPHIVPVYDAGCVDGRFYIAMQFIDGRNLFDHVRAARERGWPSPLYADPVAYLNLFIDVVEAIDYAHNFSPPIIHCDLKPSNVIVGTDGTVYVLDFGLARTVDPAREEKIGVRGTPSYMAPEQITGRSSSLGIWTDIYGLGGLLYVLLAGQPPVPGEASDLFDRIVKRPPERPTVVLRGTPEYVEKLRNHALTPYLARLEEISLKCLAKRPEDRYRMASRLGSEVRSVLVALQGGRPLRSRRKEPGAESQGPTESQKLLFRGTDPARVARLLRDRSQRAALLEAFRARLVERLNARRPLVPEYPRPAGPPETVQVLKVTPERIYLLCRGEVDPEPWPGVSGKRLIALAEAAGVGEPDDCLALGFLRMGAGNPESGGEFPEGSPSGPA